MNNKIRPKIISATILCVMILLLIVIATNHNQEQGDFSATPIHQNIPFDDVISTYNQKYKDSNFDIFNKDISNKYSTSTFSLNSSNEQITTYFDKKTNQVTFITSEYFSNDIFSKYNFYFISPNNYLVIEETDSWSKIYLNKKLYINSNHDIKRYYFASDKLIYLVDQQGKFADSESDEFEQKENRILKKIDLYFEAIKANRKIDLNMNSACNTVNNAFTKDLASEINANKAAFSSTSVDFIGLSTEGGEQTIYYSNNKVILKHQTFLGETGRSEYDYYFNNESIFYITVKDFKYHRPIYVESNIVIDKITSDEYFLNNKQKLCSWYRDSKPNLIDDNIKNYIDIMISHSML